MKKEIKNEAIQGVKNFVLKQSEGSFNEGEKQEEYQHKHEEEREREQNNKKDHEKEERDYDNLYGGMSSDWNWRNNSKYINYHKINFPLKFQHLSLPFSASETPFSPR